MLPSHILKLMFVKMVFIFTKVIFVIPIRLTTSHSHFSSAVTLLPRYSCLSSWGTRLPSSMTLTSNCSFLFVCPITFILPLPTLIFSPLLPHSLYSAFTKTCSFSRVSAYRTVSSARRMLFLFLPPIFSSFISCSLSINLCLYNEASVDRKQLCLTHFFFF